ncbi:hypothetical protein HIM_11667 [Hirsutella minnesotensis 3608]|uniref:Uncharacterized protein n=1 Tax=Hirsutella minnesotensis 3608 TaxID=1043627 RepID=A0A0F7ZFD5_9HYPO|nr:hypothetical protein HIM_11667 [Hirsutella minnesotensis 3608]
MCSITRHHKARLKTNNEFYVVHFFSKPVSTLVFRYLVYIRPVAQAVLRKCFQHETSNVLLFSPISQAVQKPQAWTTTTFTKELRRQCDAATGIPSGIGAQLYRQISIAITERHIGAAAAHFKRFDDVTRTAGSDMAYAWQSSHRPIERHTTYGLDGAFPDHLQPALLRIYAKASESWHDLLWRETAKSSHASTEVEIADAADPTSGDEPSSQKTGLLMV